MSNFLNLDIWILFDVETRLSQVPLIQTKQRVKQSKWWHISCLNQFNFSSEWLVDCAWNSGWRIEFKSYHHQHFPSSLGSNRQNFRFILIKIYLHLFKRKKEKSIGFLKLLVLFLCLHLAHCWITCYNLIICQWLQ